MTTGRRIASLVICLLLGAPTFSPARACDLDDAPTSRWSLTREGGIAWLRTPCGERFYSLGVNILDGGNGERAKMGAAYRGYDWQKFAPSLGAWVAAARERLHRWGFNSAGGWSLPPDELRLPTVINLELGRHAKFHWFDPFAPDMPGRMTELAKTLVAPYRNSPYRIGYFSDNEVGWWAGALFGFYAKSPASSYTKQRLVALLRRHYDDNWRRFVADFVPPPGVDTWAALRASTAMTQLRPGGAGIAVVRRWAGIVAERYYALAAQAIHAADPDALYFGDRLPIYYDPAAVRAMAAHVDAIATNYNVDAGDGWVARYYFAGLDQLSGGKPVLVSEWFFAARENRTGNVNNGHLMTVETQAERAKGAAAATVNFARIPTIVGDHWFQYYDHPKGGRLDGEDYDFGLVDVEDRPYRRLTAALAAANAEAPAIHEAAVAATSPQPAAPVELPHAAVDVAARSLTDWPKPASPLPPLVASPGAVTFGEVYLTWSDKGLAVATVGQDYFDIGLLAYRGDFPLEEAYRLELGIDAGAGARRATLFFIPPKTKVHDYPEMQARLCAGAAEAAIAAQKRGEGCRPVPGAAAVYFGADQPRIAAELLIPWSALGIAPPAPGQRLKAEVALTSWHRERWMSLSGRPPNAALADPAGWREMQLGDGLSVTAPASPVRQPG